jgi:AhpD family alkylhydroperoxidase
MARIPYPEVIEDSEIGRLHQQIRRERSGRVPNLYRMLLNSPTIAAGWLHLLTAIRQQALLRGRYRELAILRIAQINEAPYEFEAHVPFARREGVTAEEIAALGDWPKSAIYSQIDRSVLAYTDAMTRDIHVTDDVFETLRAAGFDDREMVELTATIAAYSMVSRFLEALKIDPEQPA